MSEWWTYRLSDFLMFSPRTYWRLVELYNNDVWPAQLLAAGAGLSILLATVARPGARRIVAASLGVAWLWVGWAFHWQRYTTINWAAAYLAAAFVLQAIFLIALGLSRGSGQVRPNAGVRHLGRALAVCGVLLYPLIPLATGRSWAQAEVFGLMPEPTAVATIGFLLAGGHPHSRWLCIVPALSLVIGFATLWLLSR